MSEPAPDLVEQINQLLPQTQCTKCGFDGCLPYAQAIAGGQTDINRCPPGGPDGVVKLSQLLNRPVKPIDPSCGAPGPLRVAVIEEEHCIGCTLCIEACPVDAIVGANKRMHTVLADWCTGCDLCLPPCPVDCIVMIDATENPHWTDTRARQARQRHEARNHRRAQAPTSLAQPNPSASQKQAAVSQALSRARARRELK